MRDFVLVTGASSGIGKAFAEQYAEEGRNLILVARSKDKLEELCTKLKDENDIECHVIAQDLSEVGAAEKVFDQAQKLGHVETLINNAGYTVYGEVAEVDPKKLKNMIDLNITAVTELAHFAAKHMKQHGGGKIMNVASTAAYLPGPIMAVYHATKSYVLSFSIALREELINDNIKVSALCPGFIATGFQEAGNMNTSLVKNRSKMMSPDEVAEVGREGLVLNKASIIPGLNYKLMMISLNFIPATTAAKRIKKAYKS